MLEIQQHLMRTIGSILCVLVLGGVGSVQSIVAQEGEARPPCEQEPGYQKLDFWVGTWDVFAGEERKVGTNRIDKVLKGCAIIEHWTSARGSKGISLFYYNQVTDVWKQVWVTQDATAPGGLKEKQLIEAFGDGGVRFQGEIPLKDGSSYLDRTTLTPLPDGRVRQVIARSMDGGKTWKVGFDAYYVRQENDDF